MAVYLLDKNRIAFPAPVLAEEDGLLAVGGDLCVERLLLAYENGIFPWYSEGDPILWWCPKERFILRPEKVHVSHSMKKFMRKHTITVQIDRDFTDTIHRCRTNRESEEGTWITDEMEQAYIRLHEKGYATSVEAYVDGVLAGGLYGVSIGRCFFGESMFSDSENGSKLALIFFCRLLQEEGFLMVDCQFHTDHLASMGGEYVSFEEYQTLLRNGTGVSEED